MPEYLVLTLAAPFAAMGEIAVGERRGSWNRPARSAVLGLVAASLGLNRDAAVEQAALAGGYGVAVLTLAPGRPFSDYHTAQAPPQTAIRRFVKAAGRPPATRREELAAGDLETILSSRAYRSDGVWLAVLWPRPGARWPLPDLAAALRRPRYAPFFGRRSCAFGLPLIPACLDAEGLEAACRLYLARDAERGGEIAGLRAMGLRGLAGDARALLAFDPDAPGAPAAVRRERRRDDPRSRSARLFAEREESIAEFAETDAAAAGEMAGEMAGGAA